MSLPIRTLFAATVLALSASQAYAQTYPDRPIKIIVPYGPGGTDMQMRLAAPFMSKQLGQPIVVENKAGVRFTHVPHTGMGQVIAAMMNGSVARSS